MDSIHFKVLLSSQMKQSNSNNNINNNLSEMLDDYEMTLITVTDPLLEIE